MAVSLRQEKLYTREEYLTLEESAAFKSEYYKGVIYAMAGGTYNHEMICGNVYSALRLAANAKSCIAFTSNMKLLIEAHGLYTYPDSMLICGKPKFEQGRTDTVLNPLVLVEVLSKSTRNYDHGQKFEFYQAIPTFQEYLLIDQDRIYVEHYHKVKDSTWVLTILREPEARLVLQSIDLEISVRQLYENVDWLATTQA